MKYFSIIYVFVVLFALVSTFNSSFAQSDWKWERLDDPVLNPGPSGSWDDGLLAFSRVTYHGNMYHMWYGGAKAQTFTDIGYATSQDGITWKKYDDPTTTNELYAESDPVLVAGQEGEWDEAVVSCPYVLFLDGTYHMWYGGSTDPDLLSASIGHAISTDGISWQKDTLNNPVLTKGPSGTWDDTWVFKPSVLYIDGYFHMWYDAYNGTDEQVRIGHATSPDGVTWSRDPNNPVLSFGSSQSWDYPRVDGPSVIYDGNIYHMWYSGGHFFTWQIGYATSPHPDSLWTKDPQNPVFARGTTGSWDDKWVGFCAVIDSADSLRKMWYSGGNADWDGHIGYAYKIIDAIEQIDSKHFPEEFSLKQNYPNPFNPSTTIKFQIPTSEFITLKVYNILGEEVATLVSKKLNIGNHTYTFDGKNLASGIYYYQLVAGDYREVRKMIMLK